SYFQTNHLVFFFHDKKLHYIIHSVVSSGYGMQKRIRSRDRLPSKPTPTSNQALPQAVAVGGQWDPVIDKRCSFGSLQLFAAHLGEDFTDFGVRQAKCSS